MAQNVTIAGASYEDVPAVEVPVTGGGTATFVDTSDATATADKIASGYSAYVNGAKVAGTGTGGGGASNLEDGAGTGSVQVIGCAATNSYSFAEGEGSEAVGESAHSEGYQTLAYGFASHAEGETTTAAGSDSHAEGFGTYAGFMAHAEGYYSRAESSYQHAEGKCNIADNADTYAHIVGNGANANSRSNAHTLDWNGNAWFAGDVYIGSTSGTNKDAGSKKLAVEVPVTSADNGKIMMVVNGVWTAVTLPNSMLQSILNSN